MKFNFKYNRIWLYYYNIIVIEMLIKVNSFEIFLVFQKFWDEVTWSKTIKLT